MLDLPNEKVGCHHTGFAKSCRKLVTSGKCNRWIHMQGVNQNTGAMVDMFDCVDNWGPKLMTESSQFQRQTAASTDKVATEVRAFNDAVSERNDLLQLGFERAPKMINGKR